MVALQHLQQQTAQLHQQFLEGQNASQQHYHTLLQQQQRFLDMCMGVPEAPAPSFAPAAFFAPAVMSLPAPATTVARAATPSTHAVPGPETHAPVAAEAPAASAVPRSTPEPPTAAGGAVATPGTDLAKILLDIVSDKTGYPAEVLELKMELDADLGIDSIKRVEILSALQDKLPDAPKVGPDQLGTLGTLQSLLDLIPGEGATPAAAPKPRAGRRRGTSQGPAARRGDRNVGGGGACGGARY